MDIGIHTGNFPHLCTDHPGPISTDYAAMRAAGFDCADLSAICDIRGPYYTSDLQTAKEMAKKSVRLPQRQGSASTRYTARGRPTIQARRSARKS